MLTQRYAQMRLWKFEHESHDPSINIGGLKLNLNFSRSLSYFPLCIELRLSRVTLQSLCVS
jgi:hypothetical protein